MLSDHGVAPQGMARSAWRHPAQARLGGMAGGRRSVVPSLKRAGDRARRWGRPAAACRGSCCVAAGALAGGLPTCRPHSRASGQRRRPFLAAKSGRRHGPPRRALGCGAQAAGGGGAGPRLGRAGGCAAPAAGSRVRRCAERWRGGPAGGAARAAAAAAHRHARPGWAARPADVASGLVCIMFCLHVRQNLMQNGGQVACVSASRLLCTRAEGRGTAVSRVCTPWAARSEALVQAV